MAQKISIKCKTQESVEWKCIKSLQGPLKTISEESKEKLKNSIISNGFTFPMFVWQSGKDIYSIDGVHRKIVLLEMEQRGYIIPERLPAVYIEADTKNQAKKLILAATSQYAKTSKDELSIFIHDLDIEQIKSEIEIPGINIDDEKHEIQHDDFRQYKAVHFLITSPIEVIQDVLQIIGQLSDIEGVEIEQGPS